VHALFASFGPRAATTARAARAAVERRS